MCKKNDYSTSNIEKEQIILKCFITKEDIKKLRNSSNHDSAIEIFNLANKINEENDAYVDSKYVQVSNVLKVLGIKDKDIFRNAAIERKILFEKENQKNKTKQNQNTSQTE